MRTPHLSPAKRLEHLAYACAALAMLNGGGHLIAWLSGFMADRGVTTITMKTNTALGLFLSGLALALLIPTQTGRARQWAARVCAVTTLMVGALTLSEHLFGWDLGIDQLLAQEPPGAKGVFHPNRMGPPAALIYTLAGISLLFLSLPGTRRLKIAQGLALGICLVALLGTLGHMYGVERFYALERLTAIAWPTAVGLLVLGVGILCARSDSGLMAPVTAKDPGGIVIRRLLIPAIILPVILGWVRLVLQELGIYETELGTAFLVLGFVILFSALVIGSGRRLSRSAGAERAAQQALRESEANFRRMVETSPFPAILHAEGGEIVAVNAAWTRISGYSHRDIPTIAAWTERAYGEKSHPVRLHVEKLYELSTMVPEGEYVIRTASGEEQVWDFFSGPAGRDSQGRRLVISTASDVTNRKQAEEELRRLTEQLEQRVRERTSELSALNRELEAFSYSVSHDLRAPLRHITNFVELLAGKYGEVLDDQGKRYIRIIADAARRLGFLIDDLLTFSRLGRAAISKRAVDLQLLTEEVRKELAPQAEGRSIEWKIGELLQVQADPALLRTVVTNLLSNALKYTGNRSPAIIEVGCRKDNNELVYWVKDNGAGFDMRYADKLFGVFQRLHRSEEFEGTGIGLASVRRIIQRHGGRTWAEGEIDKGATFYFSLPMAESEI